MDGRHTTEKAEMTTMTEGERVADVVTDRYQRAHIESEGAYLIDFCTCREDPVTGGRVFTCATNIKGGSCTGRGQVCGGYCSPCFRAHMAQVAADAGPRLDPAHLRRQREWSRQTFGPGRRTKGVIDHIRKELVEIESDPDDWREWIDVVILALDGAWRHGGEPREILDAIFAKQAKNEARKWPDWRTASEDQAIEHDRTVPDGV